jgi:hypothetical protein
MSYDRGVRAEVVIAQGKKTLIAYRAGMTEAMYFTDEDQKAVRFTDPGVYAVPAFSLSGNPEKGFGLNWQFNPQKSLVKFADVLDGLVESEYLNEAAGIRQLLNYAIKRGTLPVGVSTADGRSTYSWIRPRVDEPTFMKMEFQVSDDRLLKLVIGEFTCESIHYGKTDSFQLSPPAWPSVEIVSRKKMDVATMLKLFSAASTLIARFAEESDQ